MEHYLIPRKPALAFAGFLLVLVLVNMTGIASADRMVGAVPVFCPFEAVTGIPCPGCGMTRAMLSLIAGDIGSASASNPFCFFLVFTVIASILPARWLERVPPVATKFLPYYYISVLILVIAFWVFERLIPILTAA